MSQQIHVDQAIQGRLLFIFLALPCYIATFMAVWALGQLSDTLIGVGFALAFVVCIGVFVSIALIISKHRCPRCGAKTQNITEPGQFVHMLCSSCDIIWDLRLKSGDD